MKKRLLPLFVLTLAVVLAVAPAAMADHCRKCKNNQCSIATTGGFPTCDVIGGTCTTSGSVCTGPHPIIDDDPLASEFTVVSVERLDAPKPAAPSAQVASLQTPPTAVNR